MGGLKMVSKLKNAVLKEPYQSRATKNLKNLVLDTHKLEWHRPRVEKWLAGDLIAPITIDCALSRACNFQCTFCYAELQTNKLEKITKKVAFDFLDDAAEIGVKGVSFVSDGESTVSPHWVDAIVHGKEVGLDMALGTNGVLIKDEQLEQILPSLTYLRFNVSAGEPKRYAQIMGCKEEDFDTMKHVVAKSAEIQRRNDLDNIIGLQMVLMPQDSDQILPFAKLGKELGTNYSVIKHCSDDEDGSLGVDYDAYYGLVDVLKEAEEMSTEDYMVRAKWSKILSGGKRRYDKCYGPAFMMQFSGSGLVAPCGMLFNDKYKDKHHIGHITNERFKDIWKSDRYKEVMNYLSSTSFDPRKDCGTLCLQHKVNEYLFDLKEGNIELKDPVGEKPFGVNFI
jgi:MoaA/NifB/PqqE/SkfB family radical SAM enzyme